MGSILPPWTELVACISFSTLSGKMKVQLGSIFRKILSMIIKNSWYELYMSLFQFYSKLLRAQHWQTLDCTFLIIWQEEASLKSVQLIWYPTCADCLHCCLHCHYTFKDRCETQQGASSCSWTRGKGQRESSLRSVSPTHHRRLQSFYK